MKHFNIIILLLLSTALLIGQDQPVEHPQEHPKEQPQEHPKEHPKEHPTDKTTHTVSADNLAKSIEKHIASISDTTGLIKVTDDVSGEVLELKLVKIHKDRLCSVGTDTYFACADFETADGETFDLDFFMQGETEEELLFDEMTIHKEDGVARYNWIEEDGTWKKVKGKKN